MSLSHRRLLFACFVLVFIILVPLVLIYATGHTINWRRFSLEKTGTVLINSEPSGATIYIDGKSIEDPLSRLFNPESSLTTQARVKDLLPGQHTLRLELNGYWPWENTFNLAPGEAVNFGTVVLYSQSTPEEINPTKNNSSSLSPQGTRLLSINGKTISIISTADATIKKITASKNFSIENIDWSADDSIFSFGKTLINLSTDTEEELFKQVKNPVSVVHWDKKTAGIAYGLSGNTLYSYNTQTQKTNEQRIKELQKNEVISDFEIYASKIYIIAKSSNGSERLLSGTLNTDLALIDLPTGHYRFVALNGDRPLISNGKKTYIIDEPLPLYPTPRLLEISGKVSIGQWFNQSIIYSTPLELRRWDNESSDYLLTRLGLPINALLPLSEESVILATPNDIRIYTNGREPFSIILANIKNVKTMTLSGNKKILYVDGTYENAEGIFAVALQH